MSRWRRGHRALAGAGVITLLLWALSGATHPLMGLVGPRPVQFTPPSAAPLTLPSGWTAGLAAAGVSQLNGARALDWAGEAWIQLWGAADAAPRYWQPGLPQLAERDAAYAEFLARHYSGHAGPLRDQQWISGFSDDYPAVNRVLPIWRVRFESGLWVDVETAEDRLIGMSHPLRRGLSTVFRQAHTLAFLGEWPVLRRGVISLLVLGTIALTLMGLVLAMGRARGRRPLRRAHRLAGMALALPLLTWTTTGLFHLWTQAAQPPPQLPERSLHPVAAFATPVPVRRIWSAERGLWGLDAAGQYRQGDTVLMPAALAARLGGGTQAELVTRFGGDYGFVYRRLPVWRVAADGGVRRFVDLSRGQVVTSNHALERAELWSFSRLHKWQLFDGLGRPLRDALMSLVALALAALAIVGWRLRRRP